MPRHRYSVTEVAVTPDAPPGITVTPTSEHCDAGKTGAFRLVSMGSELSVVTTFELMVATICWLERPLPSFLSGCTTSVTSPLIMAVENDVPHQYAQALLLGAGYETWQSVLSDSFG